MIPSHFRKQIHAATYYLVFGLGMSIEKAEATLEMAPRLIPALSAAGSAHWRGCEMALLAVIRRAEGTDQHG
jgi:hypothetical protein